jgi:ribonuclease HI
MTYKLYTDGCHYIHLNAAGIGGYLVDDNGNQVWEFSEQLSNDKALNQHEVYALEYGLKKCIESGVTDLECFMDAKSIAETFNVKDKDLLNSFVEKDKALQLIVPLLEKFNNINFFYLPRDENKQADKLSRQQLFINIPQRSQVAEDGFQAPTVFCTQQFMAKQKKDFVDLKKDVNHHYLFNLIHHKDGVKIEVHEMEQFPEVKVLNVKTYELDKNWVKHHFEIINEILENSKHNEVGLIFWPRANSISHILRGLIPITKKAKEPLEKFSELSSNFSKIIIHDDNKFLKSVFPEQIKDEPSNKPLTLEEKEEMLIENLRVLSQPDYKLGSNPKLEKFFELSAKKLEDVVEIQKKYFSEILKLSIKIENENRRLNHEIIARGHKEEVIDRIAKLKENLESKGIKLKM